MGVLLAAGFGFAAFFGFCGDFAFFETWGATFAVGFLTDFLPFWALPPFFGV